MHSCVLISPFFSFKGLVSNKYGRLASGFVKDSFRNDLKIKDVRCPILLIHGENDDFVDSTNSKGLYGRLNRFVHEHLGESGYR